MYAPTSNAPFGCGGEWGGNGGTGGGSACWGGNGGCGYDGVSGFGDGINTAFTDLGASLQDVDWSKEQLEDKGQVSSQYWAAAEGRSPQEIAAWRAENLVTVKGNDVTNPILSFEETGFPQYMLDSFGRQKFEKPTTVQSCTWGPAMAGRDLVGVAKTGSGKTLAFGIPGLLHISAQPTLQRGDGPLMLVLAPTRELAIQIKDELAKVLPRETKAVCCYGGAPKRDQAWELKNGAHVVIATPGRLIDFIESGTTNLRRITYLVMDEADRMLDMGFEPDVRKIVGQIRPDRQTLLFSATWPRSVQGLARDFQKNPVQINVGSDELRANADITQEIVMCGGYGAKLEQLKNTLWQLEQEGITKMIIFAGTKKSCEELSNQVRDMRYLTAAIHGDKQQSQRESALWNLKNKPKFVLVATDVAARGIDIPNLPAVINFDMPDQLEDYVHRIGRTGRAGNKGRAISFFVPAKDCGHARGLIDLLKKNSNPVPPQLEKCTMMTPPPKMQYGGKRGGGGGWGGGGAGKGGGKGRNTWSPY